MAITYTWMNEDRTALKYADDSSTPKTEKCIPVAANNRDYRIYLASGLTAGAYVAPPTPPAPPEPTAEEKLAATGLTTEELQSLLGL